MPKKPEASTIKGLGRIDLEPSTLDMTQLGLPRSIGQHLVTLPRYKMPEQIKKDLGFEPYAGLALLDSGYALLVDDERISKLPEWARLVIMLHEYAHLAYGHVPYAVTNKLDPKLWNIATDAWINNVWPAETIDKLNMVSYKDLLQHCPALPPMLPSPRIIYNTLIALGEEKLKDAMEALKAGDFIVVPPDKMTPEQAANCSLDQLEASAALREALESGEVPDSLKDILQRLKDTSSGAGLFGGRVSGGKESAPLPVPWLQHIIERLRGMSRLGEYVRRRGWYRQGRTALLPGGSKRAGPLAMIAIDVSGSTSEYWPMFCATARMLSVKYRLQVCIYSDDVIYLAARMPPQPQLSGGTRFGPVWRAADRIKANLVVNFTDGDNADGSPPLPRSPVIWVYLPGCHKHKLRAQDREFMVK